MAWATVGDRTTESCLFAFHFASSCSRACSKNISLRQWPPLLGTTSGLTHIIHAGQLGDDGIEKRKHLPTCKKECSPIELLALQTFHAGVVDDPP